MKFFSGQRDVDRRIGSAEDRRSILAAQLEEVADEVWRAHRERERIVASERAVDQRRTNLAYAVVRGEDPVIPDEDAAAVAGLVAALPSGLEERRRAEVEALTNMGHIKLGVHDFDPAGARRRGFADEKE